MWDSNQKNQPGDTKAKPPHPHQEKPYFTVIHPGSLGQHNKHIITCFTMISTRSLGQTSMYATRFLHLHREEFSCILVSQALSQSKPGSLGPKPRPTLQHLPHIPSSGITRPNREKTTSWLYRISCDSPTRILRPTKETQSWIYHNP